MISAYGAHSSKTQKQNAWRFEISIWKVYLIYLHIIAPCRKFWMQLLIQILIEIYVRSKLVLYSRITLVEIKKLS